MKTLKYILCALNIALLLICCSEKPPKEEREMAEKAYKDALLGKDCDREDYLAAEELLNMAREAVNNKKYDEARTLFLAAKERADAIAKYVREHPDECTPKDAKGDSGEDGSGSIAEQTFVDEANNPSNPDMEFPTIHFEFDQATIYADDLPLVEMMISWMQNFPEKVVRIEGHADERGSIDYNLSLGEKRAIEVKTKLLQAGIDPQRIKIISYGEEQPVDPASNEDAWFKNRRAEFKRVN
ncbi:OmpA family protein [bacterium]|nr:OmpA family protein [bacterium]MBR6245344.1 OmpA family protein [bacterium]